MQLLIAGSSVEDMIHILGDESLATHHSLLTTDSASSGLGVSESDVYSGSSGLGVSGSSTSPLTTHHWYSPEACSMWHRRLIR